MKIVHLKGNEKLLEQKKVAFLCSRKVPAGIVLKCYDWAIEQREAGNCVISGFQSQIEKDVLHFLLKGNQPVIVALARSLKSKIETDFIKPIEEGRLLIISPFDKNVQRVSVKTAEIRNKLMIELAESVTVGYAAPEGNLNKLINSQSTKAFTFL